MYIDIPGFETRGVWEITQKVGNLSGSVNIHSTAYDTATGQVLWVGQEVQGEKRMRHSLGFGFSQRRSQADVIFHTHYTNLEDIFAIEAVFAEMTRLIPLIASGEVDPESGFVEIHRKGAVFAFKMNLSTSRVKGYVRDENDAWKPSGVVKGEAFTNRFSVYVITPNGEIEVGAYDLYSGMTSALRVAHDFEVMRALIDGKPESEILAIKPLWNVGKRTPQDNLSMVEEALSCSSSDPSENSKAENPTVH